MNMQTWVLAISCSLFIVEASAQKEVEYVKKECTKGNACAQQKNAALSLIQTRTRHSKVSIKETDEHQASSPPSILKPAKNHELHLERATHHASKTGQWKQAEATANQTLHAVKWFEANLLQESEESHNATLNATAHANMTAAYKEAINRTVSNENRTACRLCAKSESELIKNLASARGEHAQAQNLSLALAMATKNHEASSADYHKYRAEFRKIQQEIQGKQITYKASDEKFEKLVAAAKRLHLAAVKVRHAKKNKHMHRDRENNLQAKYNLAAAKANIADELVADSQKQEEKACAGVGVPPLPPTTAVQVDLAAKAAFDARAKAAKPKCAKCNSCNKCQFCATCTPSGDLLCGALTVLPQTGQRCGGLDCSTGHHLPIEWINYGRGMQNDRGQGIVGNCHRLLDIMTTFPQPVTITGVKTDWRGSSYEVQKSLDGGRTWMTVGRARGSATFPPFTTSVARFKVRKRGDGTIIGIHMQFVGAVHR